MSSSNIEASSSTYLRLKNERGHWHNQSYNPAIDEFNGERHQAMLELQKHLGKIGTSADEIQRLMGSPTKTLDEPDLILEYELNRMNYTLTNANDTKIWIYEWRGDHDYIYFLISKENEVIRSDWFNAYE